MFVNTTLYYSAPAPRAQVHRENSSDPTSPTWATSCQRMRQHTSRATLRPMKHVSQGKRLIRIPIYVFFWATTHAIWKHGLQRRVVCRHFDETLQVGNSGSLTTKGGWPIRRSHLVLILTKFYFGFELPFGGSVTVKWFATMTRTMSNVELVIIVNCVL